MNSEYHGLSVSAVKELIQNPNKNISAIAKPYSGSFLQGQGYILNIVDGGQTFVVASYRSNIKLYKRADALLNDAHDMGLKSITFNL
ncbi:hypothetical protein HWA77_10680 [Photobacterium damselae subsp. damselae]|uniref:Uncharacterized protein n=1 Tax=Photobacterium damselae subsp. damselae TaxID=85581 RepID=A0A850QPX3_PHODD|nr:hypothetical protein [Photobacterium damselae subsp. damselae]